MRGAPTSPLSAATIAAIPSERVFCRAKPHGFGAPAALPAAELMPAAAALAHTLSPLSFSATFIPFLPLALHPEPATLVNCSPAPYIIGIERLALPALQPLASHVLLFDLDEGTVQGEEVLDELKKLSTAPLIAKLKESLQKFCSEHEGGSSNSSNGYVGNGSGGHKAIDGEGERRLQGILLSFMRDLLGTEAQAALRLPGCDATDSKRADECTAACELASDILRATSDLSESEMVSRRLLRCRADALTRIVGKQPMSPSCRMLLAAYESRTVREFLLTPASASGGHLVGGGSGSSGPSNSAASFADASWMASGLDAGQSISEHAMALDGVQLQLYQRLSSAAPNLLGGSLLSPRTERFQQRFEVGVSETLIRTFSCALHFRNGLRPGVLHVSSRFLCFESALHAQAYTKLPLSSVLSVETCRDPLFHLIPNAVRASLDDGSQLVFASLEDREEVCALLGKLLGDD